MLKCEVVLSDYVQIFTLISLQLCLLVVCLRSQPFFTAPAYLTSPGGERWERGSCNCVLITKAFLCILGGVTCVCVRVRASSHYAPTCSALLVSGAGAGHSD